MTYKIKRVDKNQPEVVAALRKYGFSVELTHTIGNGFPDFVVGFADLFTIPVELKSGKGKLTRDEIKWHENYKGYVIIAYNTEDVLKGIKRYLEMVMKCAIILTNQMMLNSDESENIS